MVPPDGREGRDLRRGARHAGGGAGSEGRRADPAQREVPAVRRRRSLSRPILQQRAGGDGTAQDRRADAREGSAAGARREQRRPEWRHERRRGKDVLTFDDLPKVNAALNAASAVLLVAAYIAIKRRHVHAHAYLVVAAVATSAAFLTCYLYYHAHAGATYVDLKFSRVAPALRFTYKWIL